MSEAESVNTALRVLEIITAWPVILLIIILFFRRQIRNILPELSHRLQKATIAGSSFEFSKVEINALQDAIESGATELKDRPDEFVKFVGELVKKLPETGTVVPPAAEFSLGGRSILWVDDRPMNNLYESSILKRLGASIVFARSTEEALRFLDQDSYDLVISDIHRVEDGHANPTAGYELLDELQRLKPRTPLLFYTGSLARLDRQRTRSAYGAADSPDHLLELAVNALRR